MMRGCLFKWVIIDYYLFTNYLKGHIDSYLLTWVIINDCLFTWIVICTYLSLLIIICSY